MPDLWDIEKGGRLSSDVGFWKPIPGDHGSIFDALAEGGSPELVFGEDVVNFRNSLLSRWPQLKDVLEPSEFDLEETPEDIGKYVLLTLPVRFLDLLPEILRLAKEHGLDGYSGLGEAAI